MSRQATLLHLLALLREETDEGEDENGADADIVNEFQNLHYLHGPVDEDWDDLDNSEEDIGEN